VIGGGLAEPAYGPKYAGNVRNGSLTPSHHVGGNRFDPEPHGFAVDGKHFVPSGFAFLLNI